MSERSPEYNSLCHCISGLTDLLQHSLSVSGKLLEKGLLTRDVHNWILTARGISNPEKAESLVSCVTDSIQGSKDKFDVLIEILREESYFDDIVRKMLDERERCTALKLSPICRVRGREEVGETIEMLEAEFLSLQQRTSSELSAKITTDSLIESLTSLPIALRNDFQPFIVGNLKELEGVDSISKVFCRLNPHFTFIDYSLLKHIIKRFGSSQLNSDMSKYVEKIQIFINETTVQELMDHWPGVREIPPHFEELRAVINEDPSSYTLRQLDDLRKRFCNVTLLSKTVLILIGIKRRSSFLLSWIIPSILLPHLKSVIGKLNRFFHVEQIYSLTHNEQNLYSMAEEYERRLLTLCDEGTVDEKEVLYLLSQPKVNPNVYDECGRTSLWHASYHGRIDLVRILSEYGADVNLPTDDEFGDTALMEACDGGHGDIAALLIDKGAKVDYKNKLGQHSLYFASFDGDLGIVHLLIQRRADIDLPTDDDYGFTALGIACQEGHIDIVRLLIDNGATINYRNKVGATPLYIASECGHHDIFQLLLDSGATMDKEVKITLSQTAVPDKLLERSSVTENVYEWILTAQGASNKDRAGRQFSCATDSIKESSTALQLSKTRESEEVGETVQILKAEFAKLQRRTSSELSINKKVTPEVLLESLTLLPITLRNEYATTLQRADSIRKILHHLNPHFTFIEYRLLAHIVDDFGSSELTL